MSAERLPDGKIRAPVTFRYTDPDGTEYWAEGQADLSPGEQDYAEWDQYLSTAAKP